MYLTNKDKIMNTIKNVGILASTIASILYILILFPQLNPLIRQLILILLPLIVVLIISLILLYLIIRLVTMVPKKRHVESSQKKGPIFSENPIGFIQKELEDDELFFAND